MALHNGCAVQQATSSFAYYATEHFRMSGVYWGLTALYLLDRLELLDKAAIVDRVLSCQHASGGCAARACRRAAPCCAVGNSMHARMHACVPRVIQTSSCTQPFTRLS